MLTVQPYQPKSDAEYEAIVQIYNACWPDDRTVAVNWRHDDETWPAKFLWERFVVKDGETIVGEGSLMEPKWAYVPGKYFYGYSWLPDYETQEKDGRTLYDRVYDYVLHRVAERNPVALGTFTREDRLFHLGWLAGKGFRRMMREPISELKLRDFDFVRFNGAAERVASQGIRILTLPELQAQDPDWKPKLYESWMSIEADVPMPDPHTPDPLEEWEKGFTSPAFCADGWFIATDYANRGTDPIGPIVGVSTLGLDLGMPEKMQTWLTGVLRTHRRKGIALAMKLRAVEFAISQGVSVIETGNEENNPMLGINKVLGFTEKPAWLDLEKKLT